MDIKVAIRESYLAKGLDEEQLEPFYAMAEYRAYEDGEVILQQFDLNKDLYILASGQAHITTGVGEPIGVIKAGMPIGEMAFLDDRPRSVSVISAGPSEAVFLPAGPLRQLLHDRDDIALKTLVNISRVLCARLRSANNNIAALMAIDESEVHPIR